MNTTNYTLASNPELSLQIPDDYIRTAESIITSLLDDSYLQNALP